jgi:hypothetical protein
VNKTTLWIVGGLAVAGIVALFYISKSGGSAATVSLPNAAPLSIPTYPPAPALPAFNVNATPNYMTFNFPTDRNLVPPNDGSGVGKRGGCCGDCANCGQDVTSQVTFSQSFVRNGANALRGRFSLGPNPSNMVAQFPPNLYPWLYQKGGSA